MRILNVIYNEFANRQFFANEHPDPRRAPELCANLEEVEAYISNHLSRDRKAQINLFDFEDEMARRLVSDMGRRGYSTHRFVRLNLREFVTKLKVQSQP